VKYDGVNVSQFTYITVDNVNQLAGKWHPYIDFTDSTI